MNTNITIALNTQDLGDAVAKIITRDSRHLGGSPLPQLVADAITKQSAAISATVDRIVAEFTGSDEFARQIRAIYRDALCGEAARMGRNAAKAAINAKEAGGT